MSALNIALVGNGEFSDRIKNLTGTMLTDVLNEIKASVENMDGNAKALAPVDLGALKQSVYWGQIADGGEVGTDLEYAPYVEFGTGDLVDVPAGLEDYAMQFKGAGVRKVNLPARPFLYPAYQAEKPELLKRILEVINEK